MVRRREAAGSPHRDKKRREDGQEGGDAENPDECRIRDGVNSVAPVHEPGRGACRRSRAGGRAVRNRGAADVAVESRGTEVRCVGQVDRVELVVLPGRELVDQRGRSLRVVKRCRDGAAANLRADDGVQGMDAESLGVHVAVVQNETTVSHDGRDWRVSDLNGFAASELYGRGVMVDGVSPREVSETDALRGGVVSRCDPVGLVGRKSHLHRREASVRAGRREDLGKSVCCVVVGVDGRDNRACSSVRIHPGDVGVLDEADIVDARASPGCQAPAGVQRVGVRRARRVVGFDAVGEVGCRCARHVDRVDRHVADQRGQVRDAVVGTLHVGVVRIGSHRQRADRKAGRERAVER